MSAHAPRRRTATAVVVSLLGALSLSGCEAYDLPLPGSPVDDDNSFTVTAEFRDVLNLVPRSPVKVNDVTVGEVVELGREGWHATATLRIQDDVELPADVYADIRQTSLLGEKYVELVPAERGDGGGGGRLGDGDVLPLEQTGRNPELEEVLGALSLLLNGGGVGQLEIITRELNAVFDGRQDRVRSVLRELDTLVGGLDEQKEDIISALESLNGLASTLNREKRTVVTALDELGPAVTVLADQHDQLIAMLRALDRLGVVGTRVVGATKEDLLKSLRHLEPIVREIADVDDQIPEALGLLISFPFPIESNDIVYGDYANTSIVFSADLNNLFQNQQPSGTDLPELPVDPDDPLGGLPLDPGNPLGGLLGGGNGGGGGGGGGDNGGGGGRLGLPGVGVR
ncbi:MCE family protein [Nocardioides sp. HDW12B]|uniref:MCE family protein n=1 Tax=Nocardioides sp. HDW12B TaxID=2714939 RepID=UPI00197CEA24|nr:MCE family protein [Nocardioides sp. HDW12B]